MPNVWFGSSLILPKEVSSPEEEEEKEEEGSRGGDGRGLEGLRGKKELDEVLDPELELLKLLDELLAGDTKCGICGKVFCTKKLLYSHERNQHVDLGNCNICHKYFDSRVKRNVYIQKTHSYGSESSQEQMKL